MAQSDILYLVINLEASVNRREAMRRQAEEFGISVRFVPAVCGATLTAEERACYDERKLRRYYNYTLSANEIGCALSHRKAMRLFLESEAEYAVILEDDARFAPYFHAGIRELTEHLRGWEVAKLNINRPGTWPLPQVVDIEGASGVRPVFSRKFGSDAVGFAYTRHAAQVIYESMESIWLPADSTIYQCILQHQLATIALPVLTQGLADDESTIDSGAPAGRGMGQRRSFLQSLRHRIRRLANNALKKKLYRKTRQEVRREE